MVITNDKWHAAYKAAVKDMKAEHAPTMGLVCAVATIRLIRAELMDDFADEEDKEAVRDCLGELLKQIQERKDGKLVFKLEGFASNASAAAKAAGFATSAASLAEVE